MIRCMQPNAATSRVEVRVRYAETDQMGVVYHANYLVWCEIGRTELIRQLGTSYADLEREGLFLAVSEATLRFHGSARYDDRVRVETTVAEVRSRLLAFRYTIDRFMEHGEMQRLVTARTTLVGLNREGRPRTLPADVVALMRSALHAG